jgi:hypothetical protein
MRSSSSFFVVVIAILVCYDNIIFNNDNVIGGGIHAFLTQDYGVIGKGRTASTSSSTTKSFLCNNDNNNDYEVNDTMPTTESSRRWFLTTATIVTTTMFSPTTGNGYDTIASSSTFPISKTRGVMDVSNSISGSGPDDIGSNSAAIFQYDSSNGSMVTIPLINTGQELLISYKVDESIFKAVLDTGSPFLMIPGSCGRNTREKSGCYKNQGQPIPGLNPTTEIFDGFQGEVLWRKAYFDWITTDIDIPDNNVDNRITAALQNQNQMQTQMNKKEVIFGVASESIMGGPGGVFFGMIRDTDARIRPSFLGQTDVQSFRINLFSRPRTLTLSKRPLIGGGTITTDGNDNEDDNEDDNGITTGTTNYIPMTNILRRRYGDPVGHYTACAKSIYVNGYPLIDNDEDEENDVGSNRNKKSNKSKTTILVIFDTGVTGMVVSRSLYDEQYFLARKRKDKTLFGNVEINFDTASSILGGTTTTARSSSSSNNEKQKQRQICTLRANKPIVTPFDPETTWKKFPKGKKKNNVHIIVMGLAFLEDRVLTVDIDKERLWVE